ncbi:MULTISPECIES: hypothetical protein [unclassified Sphingobium]|jgi:hypothetical protein|uniref:hypothetical protein n=1 Tax=unclassified Sphingobium TaxID=2611147 RepID=UPI001E412932|nr:hypothetical protein [Sphingobium sp. CECT 9361]CAH0357141.1 hypothetical protein SPH9361_04790 [Sphingobium sp. CECT 9361]
MAKKPSALAGIFDDGPEEMATPPVPDAAPEPQQAAAPRRSRRSADVPAPTASARRSSHPGKKPVLIHIPEDMHRALRQLSVEEGGEPLTVVTERLLRQYLVKRGHARFAP